MARSKQYRSSSAANGKISAARQRHLREMAGDRTRDMDDIISKINRNASRKTPLRYRALYAALSNSATRNIISA